MPWGGVLRARETQIFSSLNSHKMLLYTLVSSVAVSATIANALRRQSNFYSLAIHLSKSNRSVLILANFGLLLALLCGQCAQRVFFGTLRPQEVERLYDRLWFFVTESLLAFTIFRDDFDIPFVLMFGFLLFVKSFHWLASDRIEWMDQRPYPGPPVLFHIRMLSLFVILWFINLFMFAFAVDSTTKNGVGGMMMFASEYAILMASAMNVTAKYLICVIDLRRAQRRGGENAPPWQNKSMWVFYVELVTDFLKLATYLLFFLLIVALYGLPLNIIRDVYLTGRSFITRLRALIRYRAATRNMDERYPDATQQEMSAMTDRTCIICREEMYHQGNSAAGAQPEAPHPLDGPNMTPKKLPCGHIFHFYCLRSWLERQQSCPTCRQSVLDNLPRGQRRQPQVAPPQLQPGVRQVPNFFAIHHAGIQQQGENDHLARALGQFARNAAQPPPPVMGQQPQGTRNTGAHGWLPGPAPGVVIQYNIQYQGQAPQSQVQSPQVSSTTPQPLPPFTGFFGPNRDWHPWDLDQRWFHPEGAQAVNEPSMSASNNEASVSQSLGTPASTRDAPQTPTEATPSEAAAQAALRRFGGQFAGSSGSSLPSCRASSVTTSTSHSASTWKIPSLIPLDRDHQPPTRGASSALSMSAGHDLLSPSPHDVHPYPQAPVTSVTNPHTLVPTPNMLCSHNVSSGRVTDVQLALLDQITREAIDERIRILEGVSNTITGCVEDLVRVRSALPLPVTVCTAPPQDTTRNDYPDEGPQPTNAIVSETEVSIDQPVEGSPSDTIHAG
ncbi:hypothetical protein BS17DRAFT_881014 [Gyrodon lividus]|nr:hypothetical protein BS17DRAFT_881014 [Gyrodon lividus]